MDSALNNLQGLMGHKTQQTKPNQSDLGKFYTSAILLVWFYLSAEVQIWEFYYAR